MSAATPSFQGRRHNARSLALEVLLDCSPGRVRPERFVQEVLDRHLGSEPARGLPAADRRLATHLAYGVLRRRGTLLALLRPLVNRRPDQVEPWLWEALMLGAYQLALLTQVPAHAALHETVELAELFGRPRAKGFLNAVLRACSALITPESAPGPAPHALPLEGGRYRRLARDVLPPPDTSPVEYLALGFWFAGPAPLTLRVNLLRTTRDALVVALTEAGWHPAAGEHPQAVRLQEHAAVRELPGYAEGWFSVQDESAMRVASTVNPEPGASVLDLCAAPGGKTTHLAELMGDRGRIVACDVEEQRLRTVGELAGRLGLRCIETARLDPARMEDAPAGPFDAALVDVPCSNTGVLGRRPEARWRIGPEDVRHLVSLQERLLRLAASRVRPGGVVVYSTCSIEPEENAQVVRKVLGEGGLVLEAEAESSPGRPADGGYWARLRKA
jgi:16S rRNA (cytosine967-C5)-methyltransferase